MKPKHDVSSFVVRFTQDLWQDEAGEPRVEWRGHVHHVQDGKELHFTDVTTAVSFIQKALLQRTRDCLDKESTIDQDKVVRESNRLWERFAASYASVLADAVQQTQRQVNDVVDTALRPVRWVTGLVTGRENAELDNLQVDNNLAKAADTSRLLETMHDLQRQIQSLSEALQQQREDEIAFATPAVKSLQVSDERP